MGRDKGVGERVREGGRESFSSMTTVAYIYVHTRYYALTMRLKINLKNVIIGGFSI